MHAKSAVSLVALLALSLSAPSVFAEGGHHASHKHERPSRVIRAKKDRGALRHHGKEPAHDTPAMHPAEPEKTPEVAASMAQPMVFRTDSPDKPRVKRTKLSEKDEPKGDQDEDKADRDNESADARMERPSPRDPTDGKERGSLLLKKEEAPEKATPKPPCLRDVVEMTRGDESEKLSLTKCDGSAAPLAVEKLSILVRPESAQKPELSLASLAKAKGVALAPGIRKVDPGLVERLQTVIDHFKKPGTTPHVSVISGYRPLSRGSYHATGQALDMRIDGVQNEALVAFCKTLEDTGCGYYPNSSFVHIDVRAPKTGHVSWIDASGPGESPRYVSTWPPPPEPSLKDVRQAEASVVNKLDRELPALPADEHPAKVDDPAAEMMAPNDEPGE